MKNNIFIIFFVVFFSTSACANEWRFAAFLNDKPIGEHVFILSENGESKELVSEAHFNVSFLFFSAYRYDHISKEAWNNDCLAQINANTIENKETTFVKGYSDNRQFILESSKAKQTIQDCPMTFAYWNPKILSQSKLLNPQTGEFLDVKIQSLGPEKIEVKGQLQSAERFRIEGKKMKIDLWYSPNKEWLALKSTTPDGYIVSYKLK